MRISVKLECASKEVRPMINIIGETFSLGSKPYNTGRGRRLYNSMIPEEKRTLAEDMTARCKRWYKNGIRSDLELTIDEYGIMEILVGYCLAL